MGGYPVGEMIQPSEIPECAKASFAAWWGREVPPATARRLMAAGVYDLIKQVARDSYAQGYVDGGTLACETMVDAARKGKLND